MMTMAMNMCGHMPETGEEVSSTWWLVIYGGVGRGMDGYTKDISGKLVDDDSISKILKNPAGRAG